MKLCGVCKKNVAVAYMSKFENGKAKMEGVCIECAKGTIDDVCKNEIHHRVNPYGSTPKIISLEIENQEASLILPSEDQREDLKNEAALIIKYPGDVTIKHKEYNYFILWCDISYIRSIGSTIRFPKK